MQHPGDQPQVVKNRQPGQRHTFGIVALAGVDGGKVVQQVAVADHRRPRVAGGTRGVLQKGHRFTVDRRIVAGLRGECIGSEDRDWPRDRGLDRRGQRGDGRPESFAGEDGGETRMFAHRHQAIEAATEAQRARNRSRHHRAAGAQNAPQRGDQLEPGREKQQHRPRCAARQRGGDVRRSFAQLAIGQGGAGSFAVVEESVSQARTFVPGAMDQKFGERVGLARVHASAPAARLRPKLRKTSRTSFL